MLPFEPIVQTEAQNAYAAALFARLNQVALLQPAVVDIGDWHPQLNSCHANVTELCAHDRSYSPVRGWLYFDFGGYLDRVQFLAHSAIRAPNGNLYDITPSQATQQYPFLAAVEPEAEYRALIESGVVRLWHLK